MSEENEVRYPDENDNTAVPEMFGTDILPLWRCSACKEPIPKRAKFCNECGRIMDWSKVNLERYY